jgi:hypothetical protein
VVSVLESAAGHSHVGRKASFSVSVLELEVEVEVVIVVVIWHR